MTDRGKIRLAEYENAVTRTKDASWEQARTIYNTVRSDTFTADFGSMGKFAKAINMSKSSISSMTRAYELYAKNKCLEKFSYTAVAYMLPLVKDNPEFDLEGFIRDYHIHYMYSSTSEIRNAVKDRLKRDQEETPAPEETDEDPEEPTKTYTIPIGIDVIIIEGCVIELYPEDKDKIVNMLNEEV